MNRIFKLLFLLMAVIMMPLTMEAQTYPCLDGIEDMEFETPEDFFAYIEANCDSTVIDDILGGGDFDFPGGGFDGEYGDDDLGYDIPCLDGIEDEDFATEEEFFTYLYANCDTLTIDSLFGSWGNGDWDDDWDDYEWDEEDEMEWLAEVYGDCIGDQVFADLEAIYTYIEENCEDDWGGEWSEEDEMAWLADFYAECLGDQAFADLDAMYAYIEDNCEDYGDWGTGDYDDDWDCGDFDWSEEDEMEFLSEEFAECIGDQTFADLDEMYTYIFENCDDVDTGGGIVVDIDGDFDVDIDPACLSGLEQGFATFQEMILFLDTNCGDVFGIELPDCFLTAPTFDNDEDFFQYLEDNCSDVFDDEQGSQTFTDDQMGSLIAQYNLAGANAANEQTTVGIESIDGLNMSMFPNPAVDFVQMTITEDVIEDFQVYDVKGSMLISSTGVNSPTVTIDLVELNVGTYFVKVSTENGKTFSNTIIVR